MAPDPVTRKILENRLGLDAPTHMQIALFMMRIFTCDWGKSLYVDRDVFSMVMASYINSVKLAVTSTAITIVLCLLLGYIDIIKLKDNRLSPLALSMPSYIPSVVWGIVVLMMLSQLKMPIVYGNIVPPLITLSLTGLGILYRIFKDAVSYAFTQPFIQSYIALGYGKLITYMKSVRYSLPTILAAVLLRSGLILVGTMAVESVFSYPGMGLLFLTAFSSRDYPLLVGWGIATTVTFILIYLCIDVAHMLLDPRARIE